MMNGKNIKVKEILEWRKIGYDDLPKHIQIRMAAFYMQYNEMPKARLLDDGKILIYTILKE